MNKEVKIFLIVSFIIVCVIGLGQPYKKLIHGTDPQARCLDGTSPAIYLHEGGNRHNFLIFLMGGGYCAGLTIDGTLQTCYQRTKTQFGSSDFLPQQYIGEGYLSTDIKVSKFATWTKIIINYCDGSIHQGNVKEPYQYKDAHLYFRGAVNFRSHIQWLINTYNLPDANKIVLTGISAGGIGTYLWSTYVKSLMKNQNGFYSIPDSSIFMNEAAVDTGMLKLDISFKNLYKIANANQNTPLQKCNLMHPGEQYKCLFLQYAFKTIQGPTLLINSEYDAWAIPNILNIYCLQKGSSGYTLSNCTSAQRYSIQTYRTKYFSLLIDNFIKIRQNSVWSIACSAHGYALLNDFYESDSQKIPFQIFIDDESVNVRMAIETFVFSNERVLQIDGVAWPQNRGCAF